MSKAKKVQVKKLSEQKISHHSSLSQINHSLNNFNQSTEKPELYSESPYAQKMQKMRSTSNLKDPSLYQQSGISSPPLNPKFSMSLKQKLTLNSSFMSKIKESSENQLRITKKKPIVHDRKSMDSQFSLLDLKIQEIMLKFKESNYSPENFDRLQEYFEEIILKDKIFGPVLKKIKSAYDQFIQFKLSPSAENSRLRNEIMEFSKKLTEEIEENKRLHRKIQKFSRENAELGRNLEEREGNCRTLQEHLLKITTIDINEVPQDKTSWKVLVSENKSYAELCSGRKKKVKSLKSKEKKLMKLFWTLKQKGYPVEDIYENMNNKKSKGSSKPTTDDISDSEYISTDHPKARPRPGNIPSLDMDKVEPNSFTERNSSDSEISLSN